MEKIKIKVFDEKDEKAVDLLADLGMVRIAARALWYISKVGDCTSADIEQGTYMRQPEVSNATRDLLFDKSWIKATPQKHSGKGRPVLVFSLKEDLHVILNKLGKAKTTELKDLIYRVNEAKASLA